MTPRDSKKPSELEKAILEAKAKLQNVVAKKEGKYVRKTELENAINEALKSLKPVSEELIKKKIKTSSFKNELIMAKSELKQVKQEKKRVTKNDMELAIKEAIKNLNPVTEKGEKQVSSKGELELAILDAFSKLIEVSDEQKNYALTKKELEIIIKDAKTKLKKVPEKELKHALTKRELEHELRDLKGKLKPVPEQVKVPELSIKQLRTAIKEAKVRLKPVPENLKSISSISVGRSIKKEGEKIKRKLLPIPGDAKTFEIQNIEHIKLFSAERLDFKKFISKLEKQKQQPLLKIIINPKTKFCKIELMNKDNPNSPYNITGGGDILEFTLTYRFLFKHGYIKIENNYPLLLSDKQWIVWYLREKIELTFVDIAFAMDETVRNVRNLFNEAEKRINQILDFVVDEEHYQLVAARAMKRKGVRIQQIGDTIIEPKITEKYLIEQQQLEELTQIEELEKKVEIPREWVIKTAYKIETLEGGYYLWKEFLGALNKDSLLMIENDSLPHEEEYLINAIGLGGEIIPDIKSNFKKLIEIFAEAPDDLVKIGDTAFFMGYMDNIYSSQFWTIKNFVKGNKKNWKKDFIKIAIKAYSKALDNIIPSVNPVKYGVLINDLGVFYLFLSELEQTKKHTIEAIKNLLDAKKVLPLEFFKTKHSDICYNLGLAHLFLSKIEEKEENIKQAILNFNVALQGRTLRMYPLKHAITQVNLGIVYQKLAEIEETSLNCTLSIETYNNALRSNTLDIMPTEAAMIYNNIGLAYCTLSGVQETEYNISQALIVLNDALTIRNEAQFPVEYAITTSIIGKAYTILATVKEKKDNYEKAISAFNKAIKIFIKKYEDFYQAIIQEKEKVEEKLKEILQ
ncbi:MAG: hypothetical protein ACTSXD_13150 [Candidatus Heimdallarchaeaceae archaeon]